MEKEEEEEEEEEEKIGWRKNERKKTRTGGIKAERKKE